MVTKTETISNQRFITSYSYDEHGKMTSQTYPSGKVIGYVYDDKGELVSTTIDGVPFISDIKTNDNGLLSYTYADGSEHTRTYDANGRVTKLSYPNYTEKVNYNQISNITNIQSDAMSRAFGYDNLDRLTSYDQNDTDFQRFEYDANGNRLAQSQEANSSKTFDYLTNSNILNSIQESNGTDTTEISYEYDATGNIIKDDKHTYSYDGRNRLVGVDDNVTYQYNYDNRRVSKTVNGVKTYFIYDGHKLIGEYQLNLTDQSRQEMVYLNSTPIATVTPTGVYRIYADHLDTSRRVATNDDKAEVLWAWESKPFGESLADEDVDGDNEKFVLNLRFPGQYFDYETAHHYNINRDYNPVTGRYVQSDPIGFDGGVNGFGYVGGSPINLVDKNGLWASWGLWKVHQKINNKILGSSIYGIELDDYWLDNMINPASEYIDSKQFQASEYSYLHAMRGKLNSSKYSRLLSDGEARNRANAFVRDRFNIAYEAIDNWDWYNAYWYFGQALHTLQDATSPAHEGFQIWRGSKEEGISGWIQHVSQEATLNQVVGTNLEYITWQAYDWLMTRSLPKTGDIFALFY